MATVLALINGVMTEIEVSAGGGASVPTVMASGTTFTVAADTQVLFSEEINMETDAEIVLDGVLVEVQ